MADEKQSSDCDVNGGGCGCFAIFAGAALVIATLVWADDYPAQREHEREMARRGCAEVGR